jgi:hypothetical protein
MAALAIEVVIDTMVELAIGLAVVAAEVHVDRKVVASIGLVVAAAEVHVDHKIVAAAIGPAVVAVAAEAFVGHLADNCPYFLFPSQFSQ